MKTVEAKGVYQSFLKEKNIRKSNQREKILDIFLKLEKHVSILDLYELVRKKYAYIGQATIYRSMKVFCEAGLAEEFDLGDGVKRYEYKYGRTHHDHLCCLRCGKIIEVMNPRLEELQDDMCAEHQFQPVNHRLQIYGYCRECQTALEKE